jgi:prophage regulatory protein
MTITFLRLPEVKKQTGLGRSTIYLKISQGTFPASVSLGDRAVAWIDAEIHQWIADRIAECRPDFNTKNSGPFPVHEGEK